MTGWLGLALGWLLVGTGTGWLLGGAARLGGRDDPRLDRRARTAGAGAWIRRVAWAILLAAGLLAVAVVAAGCAGTVIRSRHSEDPRFVAMVADLRPAMERVRNAEEYRYTCVWGLCQPILPQIGAGIHGGAFRRGEAAFFNEYDNIVMVNLTALGDRPQWYQRAVLAHELAHVVRWRGAVCHRNRTGCEHWADTESVGILTVGWGVPRAEAVEQVHLKILGTALHAALYELRGGGRPQLEGHEDQRARLAAFRQTFSCSDQTRRTCARAAAPVESRQ